MASPPQKKARTSSDKVDPNREASELEVGEVQQLKLTDLPTGLLVANIFPCLNNRSDWNSFSVVNRDIHDGVESHDALIPPWPDDYELRVKVKAGSAASILPFGATSYPLKQPTWSPDGRNIACCSDDRIHIFDQCRGNIKSWEAHDHRVLSLVYSPDGRLLASSDDGRVKLWDCFNNYQYTQDWEVDDYAVAFSPDSKLVAVLRNETISLLCVDDGSVVKSCGLGMGDMDISSILFSPDGQSVIFGGDEDDSDHSVLKVWRTNRPSEDVVSVDTDGASVLDMAMSADGSTLASASDDDIVRLYKLADEGLVYMQRFERRNHSLSSLAFIPDKKYLAAGYGNPDGGGGNFAGSIQCWKLEDGTSSSAFRTRLPVLGLKFSPDGSSVLLQDDEGISLSLIRSNKGEGPSSKKDAGESG